MPHHRAVDKLLAEAGPELRQLYDRGREQRLSELSAEQREQEALMRRVRQGDEEAYTEYRVKSYANPRDRDEALAVSKRAVRVVSFRKDEEDDPMQFDDSDPRDKHERDCREYERFRAASYSNREQMATLAKTARLADDFDEHLNALGDVIAGRDGIPQHEAVFKVLAADRGLAEARHRATRGERQPVAVVKMAALYRVALGSTRGLALRTVIQKAASLAFNSSGPEAA